MLIAYMFRRAWVWIVPLIIQILSYMRILSKMGKNPAMGIIPVVGEYEMSKDLFRGMRTFWRPAIVTAALAVTSMYFKTGNTYGLILKFVAIVVYATFLVRLYYRLSKQFGRKLPFALGMILMPYIFLPVLAFGKSKYMGKKEFKPEKERSPAVQKMRKFAIVAVSSLEIIALVVGCFGLATILYPARPIAKYLMNDTVKMAESVKESDEIVGRADTLGENFQSIADAQRSRNYFFPDHSADKKVVVMEYIIGSNLEDERAYASMNIAQMKTATAKGNGLEFVLQTGGSDRWFTDGIKDATVGRYLVSGGKLSEVEMLDSATCMSEPDKLTDFIRWTKDNYPADRYMLVLWDHGGGFSLGYGQDRLNKRADGEDILKASEIISAIGASGVKFDLIGFDACLMQNIEYANALEPYADYYLASEETEPGSGWQYTIGFGKLAEDPTTSTEEFGRLMVNAYDGLNRKKNNDEPNPQFTLSLVDLSLIKPVYDGLAGIYDTAADSMKEKPAVFADMSAARSKSYQFSDKQQVDLIGYLKGLKNADYNEQVASDADMSNLIQAAQACVVYRNKDSAEGINGIAIEFPYDNADMYDYEYKELKAVKYKSEEKFFNNFVSIILCQKEKEYEGNTRYEKLNQLVDLLGGGYTDSEWYVEGFENYDTTNLFIDIPVSVSGSGYTAELPDKTWDIIMDCRTAAYMNTDDGQIYLGTEHFGSDSESGRRTMKIEDKWARIDGRLVCYESDGYMDTDDGRIYKGTVAAKLNGIENITLHIEWDAVKEGSDADAVGKVTGYSKDDDQLLFFMQKGLEQLESGDTIEFLFDYYDKEGNFTKTGTYGKKLRVITQDKLRVKDEPFDDPSAIELYGVMTDVYQRELMTEAIIMEAE